MPYGSWKDIGRFCKIVRYFSPKRDNDPLIEYAIGLLNHQIDVDFVAWQKVREEYELALANPMKLVEPIVPHPEDHISLACKWTPREGSSLNWLYDRCVIQWVRSIKPHYFQTVRNEAHFDIVFRKAKMEYRKMIAIMSKAWNLPQIKQCANDWKAIRPSEVSSKTLHNNRRAFLNVNSQGDIRKKTMHNEDRLACAEQFERFFVDDFVSGHSVGSIDKKYHNIELGRFLKSVFQRSKHLTELCYYQKTWGQMLLQIRNTGHYFLPIMDLSLYQTDRFYGALGISLMLSHVSR